MRALATLAVALALVAPAGAVEPGEALADPALEGRARRISAELRCLVCQNQSIDDSDAPLARDLRVLVRERLSAGDADAAVRDFVVSRYGEFVLLRPRLGPHTLLLWGAPLLVIAAGAAGLALALRRRARTLSAPLTDEEQAALVGVLERDRGA